MKNKTAVTEEDIPTPETEREDDLSTDPTRPAYAGDDSERVTLDKLRKVNAETNKSAETENLRYVRRVSRGQARSPTPYSKDNLSTLPPRPAYAGDDWQCFRVGKLRKDAKELRRDKNGCVIIDNGDIEFEIVWKKPEVHSDALKFQTKKISKAAAAKRRKRLEIKVFEGTPPGYYPLKGLEKDAHLAGLVRKCASLALADYNGQALTDYRFVNIETVGFRIAAGTVYCIIFRARANGQDHTFKACVLKRRVWGLGRREVYAILVNAVLMMEPESIERSGTLQELIN